MSRIDVSVARFSTDDIAPRDRLAVWREVLVRSVLNADIEPTSDIPFHAQATVRRLSGLRLLTGSTSAVRYQGTGKAIEADDIVLSFGQSNHAFAQQHGRDISIMPGDAFVLQCGSRTKVSVPEGGQFTCLRLPRALLAAQVADLDRTYCRAIPRETPSLRLLKQYLGVFEDADEALAAPAVQHSAVTHVLDLLALTLGSTRDAAHVAAGRGVRAARLSAIKDDIARNLKDETLSVGAIAARHRVTPRYIQRLFDESGTTFTQYVVGQRLARAYRLVSDPQRTGRTLTAIAFEVGFNDLSYFNRAFRRRFGMTPTDVPNPARQ